MKRKQKIALSLAALYAVSVIGIALSLHFCSGKLDTVNLFSNEISCKFCKNIPAEKKAQDNCCKNTQITLKVKDSHQIEAQFQMPKLFAIQLFLFPTLSGFLSNVIDKVPNKISNKAPPIFANVALHVFHCIFRI